MSTTSRLLRCAAAFGVLGFVTPGVPAAEPAQPASPLTLSGDLRVRYESDWDSQNASGVARTDFKGHEFRATYVITKSLNLQARLFLVEAITSVQDGKRCRIDLNWKY